MAFAGSLQMLTSVTEWLDSVDHAERILHRAISTTRSKLQSL
jgi:hypothetical protein